MTNGSEKKTKTEKKADWLTAKAFLLSLALHRPFLFCFLRDGMCPPILGLSPIVLASRDYGCPSPLLPLIIAFHQAFFL